VANQDRLFDDTDTLPLFSGTAQRGQSESFNPGPAYHQETLGTCPICHDTGRVEGRYCTCDAGNDAWYQDHNLEE
jgi:hypothetical protein